MELKKTFSKKSVKLLFLLLTSMLVATASAAAYYSLIMQPAVAINAAPVRFAQGNDWPNGSSLGTNQTWVYLSLKAYPNATMIYEQPLNITNYDSTNHTFRLRHITITPASLDAQVGNFTFINFVVQNTAGVAQASFNYTITGNSWVLPSTTSYMNLLASTTWIVYVETKATAGANDGITANIQITVDVQ